MEENQDKLHKEVMDTIEFIKQAYKKHGGYEDPIEVFREGNCGNFCTFLLEEFGENAIPYAIYKDQEVDHIITKIGSKYYDVGGEVTAKSYVTYLLGRGSSDLDYNAGDLNRYNVGQVEPEEILEHTDNYKAPIVRINNGEPKKIPSSELERMKKIKEDLEKRRKEKAEHDLR